MPCGGNASRLAPKGASDRRATDGRSPGLRSEDGDPGPSHAAGYFCWLDGLLLDCGWLPDWDWLPPD